MAPIIVITSDDTLDKDTPVKCMCVHACMQVCLCMFFIYVCFSECVCVCVSLQHANGRLLNPSAVFIQRFPSSTVVVQVTEPSTSDPVYFSWLGCVSVLNLCWLSVTAVWTFTSALVNYGPNEIQIWEFSWFRV